MVKDRENAIDELIKEHEPTKIYKTTLCRLEYPSIKTNKHYMIELDNIFRSDNIIVKYGRLLNSDENILFIKENE